jgi:tRNA dimethylallyltransferase
VALRSLAPQGRLNRRIPKPPPNVLAIFGPTAIGKTATAIAVAEALTARGERPVAVSCDAIQVYRGLDALSGAATASERARLEHRLVGFVDPAEEFSVGRFAALARAEIDGLVAEGRRPIVVGGTGLYLRAALTDLELRPPVPAELRDEVEREIVDRGPEAVHADLPPELAAAIHPNDRKRIARILELRRAGIEPARGEGRLWTAELRRPTTLVGLAIDRAELGRRIDARVDAIVAAGAAGEARQVAEAGASRTARAALGFDQLLAGDVEGVKSAHRNYARRQLTWMRKMPAIELIDRTGMDDTQVAAAVLDLLDAIE